MDYKLIFSKRLKSAREMRGLSMAKLSAAMDNMVTPQAIYKYENGKMLPGSPLLIALSKALNVSPDYFFRPYSVNISGIKFRKKTSLTVRDRKTIEETTMDQLERYIEIENICGYNNEPLVSKGLVEISSEEDVFNFVLKFRKDAKLGMEQIPDVISFLQSLGIVVLEVGALEAFDGLCGFSDNIPVIVINVNFTPERKRFTALHELGHLVMNFSEELDEKQVESLCNLFASEMLLPTAIFKERFSQFFSNRISFQDLAEIQIEYGISIDAIMYKARKSNLISDNKYKDYHIMKNSRSAFRKYTEASRIFDERSDKFERMVYQAFNRELISTSKAASLLNTSVDIVRRNSFVL